MPAQYDDAVLQRLLELQAEDTAVMRLKERKAQLPEAHRLAELTGQLAELDADIEIATKQNDEIAREQARIEGEIELVDQKIAREEARMMSGKVANPKELSSLQAEVESLKRKRGGIEDGLLEVMVQRDEASATLGRLSSERDGLGTESATLTETVRKLTAEIDAELTQHEETRSQVATDIPAELLTQYEKLREQKHGVGAASLERGTCSGCHTKLPNVEVERLRAERGLQRCDNCRRILVVL